MDSMSLKEEKQISQISKKESRDMEKVVIATRNFNVNERYATS